MAYSIICFILSYFINHGVIKMIAPEFYTDVAKNALFYHIDYINLSYFDRVFISFWIIIFFHIFAKILKNNRRNL
mgnify:CR=1 FL=1